MGINTDNFITGIDSGKWAEENIDRFGPDHPLAGKASGLVKEKIAFHIPEIAMAEVTVEEKLSLIKSGLDYCLKQVE